MLFNILKKLNQYNSCYYIKVLRLSVPIFIDNLLRMLVPLLTSMVVTKISNDAMAIIVVANVIIILAFNLLECFSQASITIISQYIGAQLEERLVALVYAILLLNILFGTILCICFLSFSKLFVLFITKDPLIISLTRQYIRIIGYGMPLYSLSYGILYIFNAYGKTFVSMIYSCLVNLLTIISLVFLMYFFAHNNYKIIEYISFINLSSRMVGLLFLLFSFKKLKFLAKSTKLYPNFNFSNIIKESIVFLRFAFNNIIESMSYHFGQILLSKIIANLSSNSLALRGYLLSISNLLEVLPLSISRITQILIGQSVGASLLHKTNTKLKESIILTLCLITIPLLLVYIFNNAIANFYIHNTEYLNLYNKLLIISVIITILKCINLNIAAALRATGDIKFLVIITSSLSLFFTVPASYLLVSYYSSKLIIIWYIFLAEECIRGLFLFKRWYKGKWHKYLLV